jgi:hypothetical protein
MRSWMLATALLCGSARADKLEDAAQLLIDRGLERWEKGDVVAARDSFASARDLLPNKPNPYRLLALADSKLGRCQEAVVEADRFSALTPASDPRRSEVNAIRDSCMRPPAARAPVPPTLVSTPSAVPDVADLPPAPQNHALRKVAVFSLVAGAVFMAIGVPLLAVPNACRGSSDVEACRNVGASFATFGSAGMVAAVPLFVFDAP